MAEAVVEVVLGIVPHSERTSHEATLWYRERPMVKTRNAKSLVRAVLNGTTDCDEAIQKHLDDNYRGRLEAPSLKIVHVALCYFNRGQLDRSLDLPDGPLTVAEIVKEFGLTPFAPLLNDQEPDRHDEVQYPVGTLVDFWRDTCRVIGRRRVTNQAMPREDEFEVFIENEDGTPLYFVGESMVEPLEEGEKE
jgi:hypothetical protein